jgi:ATP/maltotriose-dependent transcriptional regulator MalT
LPYTLHERAQAAYYLGDVEAARSLSQEALEVASSSGDENAKLLALASLGRIATALGRYTEGRAYLLQSLSISWRTQHWLDIMVILIDLAEWCAAQGQAEQAVTYLNFVLHHPATTKINKADAQRVLDTLTGRLSQAQWAEAEHLGKTLSLEQVVDALLSGENALGADPTDQEDRSSD